MVIKKGQHMSSVVMRLDSAALMTDTATIKSTCAIHFTDILTFRNRLCDGINEWQDENSLLIKN